MELGKVFRKKVGLHLFYKTYKTWSKAYVQPFCNIDAFFEKFFFHIDLNMLMFIQFHKSYKC